MIDDSVIIVGGPWDGKVVKNQGSCLTVPCDNPLTLKITLKLKDLPEEVHPPLTFTYFRVLWQNIWFYIPQDKNHEWLQNEIKVKMGYRGRYF